MKKTIILLLLVTLGSGCHMMKFGSSGVRGSGNRQTEKRTVPGFLNIEVSGAYEVEITCQKERSLEVTGDDNIVPLVTTEVRNNTLHIGSSKDYNVGQPITIRINVPDLEGISTSGASRITLSGLNNSELRVDSSGASKVQLTGETKRLNIETSGASTIEAKNLHAEKARVSSSGAGYMSVYATEQLDAHASGAARIDYFGSPKTVNPETSGPASITNKSV